MRFLLDTFLNTYLWSHIEPATAIWCACLMTYRPLFTDIGMRLRNVFGDSRQTLSSSVELVNRKSDNSNTGSDSDAWSSLGQNSRGHESTGCQDLSIEATKEKLHVVDVSINPSPTDRRFSFNVDEYECSRIAVGREASLV